MSSINEALPPRSAQTFVLKVICRGKRGIVAAIGNFLADRGCNITEMAQFDDEDQGRYFSRVVFHTETDPGPTADELREAFKATASAFGMQWEMRALDDRARVLIMVSKFDHCLEDLLYRQRMGELPMIIPAVVSNHPDLRSLVERHDVPFHVLPVTAENKREQEAKLLQIFADTRSDLVVLARYMQVLSNDLCRELSGKAINIHHSFLPGFKGAKPYHQAFDRGVKLIGATAHYVTGDLDEGPIIEQVVERVDHTFSPEQLVAAGRDSEKLALARAVKFHIESRVFLNGNKTVVFK
ncbi:formyltetrahydrofolate deformylase [Burkholderia sp. Bp9140]|uniref:formyltetrahydrofolate deformylase n=1 Tax=Burkholderia sp. Bp9140 TaxID=2184572 RepID=UPI000F58D2BE|nr:formyltetrahydrofolate deformylase [Burkholderia sp. Bp9140]RQR51599.1 formyltetrahydrofolate deformylase [Burkholderia sp. Bp9140]